MLVKIRPALILLSLLVCTAVTAAAQDKAVFSEYKGVKIGVTTDAVRLKLGTPRDKSDVMDLYVFSDNESAQFYYDAKKAVNAIMITYTGDLKAAPVAKDIFGIDVAPKDGTVFKMERYPKAGYWISYTRTTGSDAIVNIAMQKLQ